MDLWFFIMQCMATICANKDTPKDKSSAAQGNNLVLFVNGEKYVVCNPHPTLMLKDWLLEQGLTGTKVSCGQGACGACTVSIAKETQAGVIKEKAVNACLRPLLLCDGTAITTVEGLGTAQKPHPVQQRIASCNGSQCGFCTPGQVMSMYSLLRENKTPEVREVEACLEGNICRCTGYRGIHAAFHTFAGKQAQTDVPGFPKEFTNYASEADPKFPEELKGYKLEPLVVAAQDGSKWHRVNSLERWAAIVKECGFRKPRVVVGNTSVGVFGHKIGVTSVDVSEIQQLKGVETQADGSVWAGGAESLTALIDALKNGSTAQQTLAGSLSKIANNNIRNAGGWAGNLVMGRVLYFPSDGAVYLSGYGAEVTIAVAQDGKVSLRTMSASEFVQDTSFNDVAYVLVSIKVPQVQSHFHTYRQSVSRCNSHAYVNAAFRTNVSSTKTFENPMIVFGCISQRTVVCKEAMDFLNNKPINNATLQGLLDLIQKVEVSQDGTYKTGQNVEGKDKCKRETILSFVFKWFATIAKLNGAVLQGLASITSTDGFWENRYESMNTTQTLSSAAPLDLPDRHPGSTYSGPKKESLEQACGQTRYSGDIQMGSRGVYGVYITATRVGKLTAIDAQQALKQEGVVAFVGAEDVPGMNSSSLIPGEEPLFAEVGKDTIFVGQIVGVLVARTLAQAKAAAPKVRLTFDNPATPPVFTMEEALEKKQFLNGLSPYKSLDTGNVDEAFANPSHVIVEGDVKVGGQNNFYMEKHVCVAMPDDMGRVAIYGGCQTPDMTKTHVMVAMGCQAKDIVLKVRPMGGAFGGKFTRQFSTFCASAVACKALGRPVRIAATLLDDMGSCGNTRHIVNCHYRVAATKEGKIVAIDNSMVADAGISNDYSDYMVDEVSKRQDLAYDIPNYRSKLELVKTNNPTASANRAPGLAQAAVITETMVDAVARATGVSQEQVRQASLKPKEGATDQTGQPLMDWNGQELWSKGRDKFSFAQRQAVCDKFNTENRFKKRAIAMMPLKYAVGYTNMSGVHITVNINSSDGSVEVQTGCCEMGSGSLTKVLATVATELGVAFEKVSGFYPDTSVLPNHQTDGGSAGAELLCMAAKQCCDELKQRLGEVREVLTAELQAADKAADPPTWEAVCARAFGAMPTDTRTLMSATSLAAIPFYNDLKRTPEHPPLGVPWWCLNPLPKDIWQYYLTGVACSEVEVDVLTGAYTVLRSDVMMDAGHSLSPLIDLGQVEGSFVFGLGMYTQEEILMDPKDGRNKCEGTWNYKPPNNKDAPQIFNVELVPGNKSSRSTYGSKGVGECGVVLAYTAVSAVKKAILASRLERGLSSDFHLDSPATVDRVQQAMGLQKSDLTL